MYNGAAWSCFEVSLSWHGASEESSPALLLAAAVENNQIKHRYDKCLSDPRLDAGKTPKKMDT
jgi:hypothetical protein